MLQDKYANSIQLAKDVRKKKIFCRQPKVNTQLRKGRVNTLKRHRHDCQKQISQIVSMMVSNMKEDIKGDDDLRPNKEIPHFVKEVEAFTKYYARVENNRSRRASCV